MRRLAAERGVTRLAWLDDEVTEEDCFALERDWSRVDVHREWQAGFVATPPLAEALVIPCDPLVGLTEAQVVSLMAWARERGDSQ